MSGQPSNIKQELSSEQSLLFRDLLNSIDLRDMIISKASYARSEEPIQENKENNNLNFKTSQRLPKTDPVLISDELVEFNPSYSIEISINDTKAMDLIYSYKLIFQVIDKKLYESAMADEVVREFFLRRQLPRITWSFLREEIYSAMGKCGYRAIPLPLMR